MSVKENRFRHASFVSTIFLLGLLFSAVIYLQLAKIIGESRHKFQLSRENLIESYYREVKRNDELEKSLLDTQHAREQAFLDFWQSNRAKGMKIYDRDISREDALNRYRVAMNLSGRRAYEGAGIRVELDDAPNISYSQEQRDKIVHDEQLLFVVNSLINSNCLAVSINGERWTSLSKIVCNGPSIRINRELKPAPFLIEAIFEDEEHAKECFERLNHEDEWIKMKDNGLNLAIELAQIRILPFQDQAMIQENLKFLGSVDDYIDDEQTTS
ncbi:MAG: DUF881 domain-containing protein [Eubacteriales bacterium]|nr:DUF881 domain-containing protein [Eubacteriales bacterium]